MRQEMTKSRIASGWWVSIILFHTKMAASRTERLFQ